VKNRWPTELQSRQKKKASLGEGIGFEKGGGEKHSWEATVRKVGGFEQSMTKKKKKRGTPGENRWG